MWHVSKVLLDLSFCMFIAKDHTIIQWMLAAHILVALSRPIITAQALWIPAAPKSCHWGLLLHLLVLDC